MAPFEMRSAQRWPHDGSADFRIGFRVVLEAASVDTAPVPSPSKPAPSPAETAKPPTGKSAEPHETSAPGNPPKGAPSPMPPKGDVKTNQLAMKFVYISAGDFMMGTPNGAPGKRSDEAYHKVVLTKGYYLATTEVTQVQWKQVMGDEPSRFHGDENRPVENVSWTDALAFCKKLGAMDKKTYRLPTEAEWEYACRAGSKEQYAGGDEKSVSEMAWFGKNADKTTHPIGKKNPNAWGLYDMQGNVMEWCSDRFAAYKDGEATDPNSEVSPDERAPRVIRGGSWQRGMNEMRSAHRFQTNPKKRDDEIGFRVVMEP